METALWKLLTSTKPGHRHFPLVFCFPFSLPGV